MIKYFKISSDNIISSYGGIGSIVETPEASILVLPLEKWLYYKQEIKNKDIDTIKSLSIDDRRLLKKLKNKFPNLEFLIEVPTNDTTNSGYRVSNDKRLITGEIFPKWMFCPRCKKFMVYDDWYDIHRKKHPNKDFDLFCPFCLDKKGENKISKVRLEQVRFIQISKNGEISDFPWEDWFLEKGHHLGKCEKHKLKYTTSPYSDNLESIRISCENCEGWVSLTGIFDYSYQDIMHTALRSSNSVYYPNIIRSLRIPIADSQYEASDFKYSELHYMINKAAGKREDEYDKIDLKKLDYIGEGIYPISIRSLSMTSVLCSYNRLTPLSFNEIFNKDSSRHVTEAEINTRYLPAVESLGEGFLMVFAEDILKKWYDNSGLEYNMKEHLIKESSIIEGLSDSKYLLAKYSLLHTLSHILIKQMEYVCGYSAASINERIYVSDKGPSGIMIYTIAGAEGSYGGIVTMVESGKIKEILKEAIEKAKYCTNDPVCYEDTSFCFSCCLLPETSCECFNRLLDRSLIVDQKYGFINELSDISKE